MKFKAKPSLDKIKKYAKLKDDHIMHQRRKSERSDLKTTHMKLAQDSIRQYQEAQVDF
jgi:hypothetical protein